MTKALTRCTLAVAAGLFAPGLCAQTAGPISGPLKVEWPSGSAVVPVVPIAALIGYPAPQEDPKQRGWRRTAVYSAAGSAVGQAVGLRLGFLLFGLGGSYDAAIIGALAGSSFVGGLTASWLAGSGLDLAEGSQGGAAIASWLLGAGLGFLAQSSVGDPTWLLGNALGHALGSTLVVQLGQGLRRPPSPDKPVPR